MPKKPYLKKILIIGSGPIVIGQAAEFDYAGTQACKAIREEGIETILVNSNPATIMTDKGIADKVYMEPLTEEALEQILEKERPDGMLAGFGGQTGLNLAMELERKGVLKKFGTALLGVNRESIKKAEDREEFKKLMQEIGEPIPSSIIATSLDECYDFVEEQLKAGRQAYVVTPLIEESDAMDVRSATQVADELKRRFGDYSVALIHGAMKQDEKDRIMEDFYGGKTDVLVSTVVIEVGINVPNATVIVVENAERFGLAQLHQLRGRVGRGSHRSYCFLIFDGGSETARKRGEIMESSSDGFYIAEEDLKLRGPGEIFGTRQHGLPDLKIADLSRHLRIMEHARREARAVIRRDPELKDVENGGLRHRVVKMFGDDLSLDL